MTENTGTADALNISTPLAAEGSDTKIENLTLTTSGHGIAPEDIVARITEGHVEQTMAGAPMLFLTVSDSQSDFIASPIFDYKVDATLDRVPFRLVSVSLRDDRTVELGFEHRAVSYLREHKSPLKVSRNAMTRAEFVQKLVREVKAMPIRFVSPSVDLRQRISKPKVTDTKPTKGTGGAGISDTAKLTVKGVGASKAQRRQMERVLGRAAKHHAGPRATLALVVAAIGESGFTPKRNQGNPPSRYWGVLQGSMDVFSIDETERMADDFLLGGEGFHYGAISLARKNPGWSPGYIAFTVEGDLSNFAGNTAKAAQFYDQWRSEAEKIIAAYSGGGDASASFGGGGKYWKRYEFTRGVPGVTHEDSWGAIQRLAAEVRWRAFIVGIQTLYYVSDDDLHARLPRYTVGPDTDGLVSMTFDVEVGGRYVIHRGVKEARPSEATMRVRVDRWEALPGSTVLLVGYGPGTGTWLVDSVSRPLFDAEAEVNLRRPQSPLPEPAAQVGTHPKARKSVGGSAPRDKGKPVKGGSWTAPPGGAHGFKGPHAVLLDKLAGVAVNHFHLSISATTNGTHVPNSYHYRGEAFDAAGSESDMHDFAQYVQDNYQSSISELIHNPGFGIKDGKIVDGPTVFADVWAAHTTHVHVAAG